MRHRGLLGVVLALSLLVVGAALGGVITGLTTRASGVDALADLLGALLVGGALGVVMAVVLARRLTIRTLQRVTGVALVVAGALVALLALRVDG